MKEGPRALSFQPKPGAKRGFFLRQSLHIRKAIESWHTHNAIPVTEKWIWMKGRWFKESLRIEVSVSDSWNGHSFSCGFDAQYSFCPFVLVECNNLNRPLSSGSNIHMNCGFCNFCGFGKISLKMKFNWTFYSSMIRQTYFFSV